ncbi:MAG: hypothetical protein K9N11_09665 [Lentisphaeria bacterium]|nr:hypothetical protein [Candidatus Neomarinimicrobiota bacterium]MCF7843099.1 hypothetical protein [Lentisphaeria bacterium]
MTILLALCLSGALLGQDETVLSRHVPSEFARTKLTLVTQDGLPVLYRGNRELTTHELFETIGEPQCFDEYNQLHYAAQKYQTRSRWLHTLGRFSAFGSLFFSASRWDKQSTTLQEWLPAIEMATFGSYAYFMARRYDYRAAMIQKKQLALLSDLNLDQWVSAYNHQLYQRLIDSGLTFNE